MRSGVFFGGRGAPSWHQDAPNFKRPDFWEPFFAKMVPPGRIVDAERPPTPWETGGGSVMVESEKLADTSGTGEKIIRKLS